MSESLNYNEGKLRPTLILKDMPDAFNEILKVREYGCKKYDRDNWSLSIGTDKSDKFLEDNKDSIFRHLIEDSCNQIDDESGCYHLAQAAIRCMMAIEYYKSMGK